MQLVVGIIFLNPLCLLLYNYAAWYFFGYPGLALALLMPIVMWCLQRLSDNQPSGLSRYVASMQLFYLSSLIGGWVMLYGVEVGSIIWVLAGAFMILPALTLLAMLLLFS
jgi:hypothetical protein